MKTKNMIYLAAALLLTGVTACEKKTKEQPENEKTGYVKGLDGGYTSYNHVLFNEDGKENPQGMYIGNGEQNFVFKGEQTLPKGTYILKGWVYVAKGSVLKLEPGTIIKGDKSTQASLIVEPGGKLIAQGTAQQPIVFTSNQPKGQRKPGDWGGVILCGNAPVNQSKPQIEGGPRTTYGGSIADDNSGVLSYVRIEFAGFPFQKDKEINGLTIAGVGTGTQLDHIQVSYSNDDSFEFFGGTVKATHLIAYKGWDDDFDTDFGYSGTIQFGLSVRDPHIADTSQSNSFESDNASDGADIAPYTSAIFSNITLIGPMGRDGFTNDKSYITAGNYFPNNGASLGLYQSAFQIRRSSRLNCFNSVAVGYPIGLIIDGEKGKTVTFAKEGKFKFENIWFAGMGITGSDANKRYEDNLYTYPEKVADTSKPSFSTSFFLSQTGNAVKEVAELKLTTYNQSDAAFMPASDSPLLQAASFADAKLAGFQKVNFIGAFAAGDKWLDGWTSFDPNQNNY